MNCTFACIPGNFILWVNWIFSSYIFFSFHACYPFRAIFMFSQIYSIFLLLLTLAQHRQWFVGWLAMGHKKSERKKFWKICIQIRFYCGMREKKTFLFRISKEQVHWESFFFHTHNKAIWLFFLLVTIGKFLSLCYNKAINTIQHVSSTEALERLKPLLLPS